MYFSFVRQSSVKAELGCYVKYIGIEKDIGRDKKGYGQIEYVFFKAAILTMCPIIT